MYAKPINQLIAAFSKLPSVGPRTAERFVFYLLKSGKKDAAELALALKELIESVKSCETCWDFSDVNPCSICTNQKRERAIICVVKDSQEAQAIEKTGNYAGWYHILRGTIQPGKEEAMKWLKMNELLRRAKNPEIKEIILALNPDLSGETTMMLLETQLKKIRLDMVITRLARGLPMGSDIQYADEITLGSALKYRVKQ